LQVRFDEFVEIAVEDAIDVADFNFRSMIFREAVRLENVRPDLAAPRDIELAVFDGLRFGFLLLSLELEEARPQNLHADFLVLVLRAFVLALNDDVRRDVRDAHGGIRGIHVLAALPRGSVRVDSQIFFFDHDLDLVVDFRIHGDRGK